MPTSVTEPGGIAVPSNHRRLGEYVKYHHRAAVARLSKGSTSSGVFGYDFPREWSCIHQEGGGPPNLFEDNFLSKMRTTSKVNKTIVVWPEEGSGIIVRLLRRGIGRSVSGYTSGYETPEFEPGWFEVEEWHWLYEVRNHLTQRDTIYVPMWAIWP